MARNKKVEILSHSGEVLHPITDGDCVIFPDGETLTHKLSEQEEVMYTPEVVNSSPMFKVGEGDSSDYSANVLDGAYQEAVLKGQTYVNTIQEPSADVITLPTPFTEYERTQSKTFTEMQDGTFGLNLVGQSYVNCIQEPSKENYVALGEALEFQNKKVEYTNDGQIKSAILKGQTLVNLALDRFKSVQISTNETITSGPNSRYILAHFSQDASLKPNTKYHLRLNSKFISGDTEAEHFKICWYKVEDGTRTYLSETGFYTPENGLYKISFTTPNDCNSITLALNRRTDSGIHTSTYEYSNGLLLEYQEGMENWDIPYFQGMQSVTMSTELENVCSRYNSSVAKNGKTFTTSGGRNLYLARVSEISKFNFKQNTKYLIQFKISNLNLDGLDSIELVFSDASIAKGDALFGDTARTNIAQNGIYRIVLTTSNIVSTSAFVVKGQAGQWENTTSTSRTLTISQIMCIEYQNGMENWDLPYFETTQLMKPLKVQSVNKNLCPTMTIGGIYDTTGLEFAKTDLLRSDFIKLNSTLAISSNNVFNRIFGYDKNKKFVQLLYTDATGTTNRTIGATSGIEFIRIRANYVDNFNIQIEEGSTATDYTPHQSKTTSALEPITLRAIGDVKDTLDLSTGEYVQRIGEITVDGVNAKAKKWVINNEWSETSRRFDLDITGVKRVAGWNGATTIIKSDKTNVFDDIGRANPQCNSLYKWDDVIVLYINDSTITTIDQANNWLEQNPIKIQYQLANPITRKISLEYPNLQTYQDITHVQSIAMDGTLIPNIYLPSDISYKVMLKPNTSYNVIVDREVIDSTNQLTVNLGGTTANITANRTVVRTPSTLSNETLTFSGKDNRLAKAMLIEGSTLINGDLPHFDGIGDVKLGRVVENLCMSNEAWAGGGSVTLASTQNKIEAKVTKQGSAVAIFPLTKQLSNGKKYFVYSPSTTSNTQKFPIQVSFKRTYNNSTSYAQQVADMSSSGKLIFEINDKNTNPYDSIVFGNHGGNLPVDTVMTIRRPILCEYIDGMENWDWESIGYFTGTKNIGNEFMRIGNKNLFDKDYSLLISSDKTKDIGNDTIEFYQNDSRFYISPKDGKFKENTQYTLSFQKVEGICLFYITYTDGTTEKISNTTTTTAKNKTIHMIRSFYSDGSKSVVKNIQLEEASSATSYVAHKHNALYLPKDEPIALSWVQGGIDFAVGTSFNVHCNNSYTHRIRTGLIDLEPNETYRISIGSSEYYHAFAMYDNSNLGSYFRGVLKGDYYFTTTKDVHKFAINVAKTNDSNLTPSALHQIRLEKVTDVHLRSVGNVHDELDLTRGVYVQRIGEVVLNGSESWTYITLSDDLLVDYYACGTPLKLKGVPTFMNNHEQNVIDDGGYCRLVLDYANNNRYSGEAIVVHNNGNLYIRFKNTKAKTIDEWKAYLSQHPLKVQYQLETPIEHKIHIPMKNESNQTIAKPNGVFTLPLMYSETNHVDINSQIYPKVQSRDYISYPVIANNSQLHTVFHNKLGTGNLTVNLCGTSATSVDGTSKCTVTTPSAISQYELRLSGARNKVSNVCVFSGDYMNVNVPYVQGMMNAVNPTVKNTGKNLFVTNRAFTDKNVIGTKCSLKDNVFTVTGTAVRSGGRLELYNYKEYISFFFEKGKKYSLTIDYTSKNNNIIVPCLSWGDDGTVALYISNPKTNPNATITAQKSGLVYFGYNVSDGATYDCQFRIQLEEASTSSQYEPYKENNCEPENGQVYFTQDDFEVGTISANVNQTLEQCKSSSSTRLRSKNLLYLQEGVYSISVSSNSSFIVASYRNGLYESTSGWQESGYILNVNDDDISYAFILRLNNNSSLSASSYDKIQPVVQEVDKEIHLRSLPNGVCDELNLQTGEYIQRIGEVVLDGNNQTFKSLATKNKITFYYTYLDDMSDTSGHNWYPNRCFVCNNKNVVSIGQAYPSDTWYDDRITPIGSYFQSNKNGVGIFTSADNIKNYLQSNPITVQYELKTPIVKQIDINNFPHSYKDGHVIIESNDPSTNVTAQMTYRCVTNRSGQIQEHTEQVEKQERQINELETLILENIRQQQNRSQNFLTSLISTLEIEEE